MILEVTKLLRYLFLIYVLNAVSIIFLEVHKLYMSCKLSGAIHSLYLSILRIHNSHYVTYIKYVIQTISQYTRNKLIIDEKYITTIIGNKSKIAFGKRYIALIQLTNKKSLSLMQIT